MTAFLDDLARSMAKPLPRRRVLRLLGGAVVAAAVPGIFMTKARAASTFHDCEPKGGLLCECNCGGPNGDVCQRICCTPKEDYECYCGSVQYGAACKSKCVGGHCGPNKSLCCKAGEECSQSGKHEGFPELGRCCKKGWRGCGAKNQPDVFCCEPNKTCCHGTLGAACCERLTKTCDSRTGTCECRPGHTVRCGTDCCNPKQHKCCPKNTVAPKHCAPKKNTCCGWSSCPPRWKCCKGPGKGGAVVESCVYTTDQCCGGVGFDPKRDKCCSPGNVCGERGKCCRGLCCGPGEVCTQDGCVYSPGPRSSEVRPR